MIRSINCILIILVLLISALFLLIATLIIATEQPESILDKLYANSHQSRNETIPRFFVPTKLATIKSTTTSMLSTTTKALTTSKALMTTKALITDPTTKSPVTKALMTDPTTIMPSIENFNTEAKNSTSHKLTLFPTNLKLSNSEKVMSIGLKDDVFYAAKSNGEIEFFNWTDFNTSSVEQINIPIHRMGFLSDGRLVVTETQTKTLHLFDQNYKVVVELKLGYQSLDLKIFNDLIYVLSRLDGTIFVYDSNLVQKFKISWNKQNSCNFIQPIDNFIFVSCDNAVLKLSNDGEVVGKATTDGALYSLAIYYSTSLKKLWSVQRGEKKIDVYDEKLQYKYQMSTESDENAVWSTIGFKDGLIFVLDYVSSTIQFFTVDS